YGSDYWLTFKQAREKGAHIRKGEKSSLVVFWKQVTKDDPQLKKEVTIPVLRHYNVFNVEQCDGLSPSDTAVTDEAAEPVEPLDAAEAIVSGYSNPPEINKHGSRAFYR